MVFNKIVKSLKNIGKNTVYYPGCLTKFAAKDIEENYKKLLDQMGIDYITIPEFVCCGSPVLSAGYKTDFENLVMDQIKLFQKYNVKKIITNCPTCYKMFRDVYTLENIEVEHFTQTLFKNKKKLKKTTKPLKLCYHDPCHLGRGAGVFNDPREVLKYIGHEVFEMEKSRESSMCCGGGGGVKSNYPKLANKIAKARLKQCSQKAIVTPCTLCYKNLQENAEDIEVFEFSEVLI